MRHGRLMLAPLLTATGSVAWAAPVPLAAAEDPAPLPPLPPPPDTHGNPADTPPPLLAEPVSLFLMGPILGGERLAQVTAEFALIELRAIEAGSLERALGGRLSPGQRAALRQAEGRFLSVAQLQDLGIVATYDPANLTLNLALVPEAARARALSGPSAGLGPGVGVRPLPGNPRGEAWVGDLIDTLALARAGTRQPLLGGLADRAAAGPPPSAPPEPARSRLIGLADAERPAPAADFPPLPGLPPSPSPSPSPSPDTPAPAALPPRVSRITMNPVLGGSRLALVTAELTLAELRAIEAGSLERALGSKLAAARRAELKREEGNFLSPARLEALGIRAAYDPANLTITLTLAPEAVGAQTYALSGEVDLGAAERARPADLALGITGNLTGTHDFSDPDADTRLLYNFAGFLNIGGRERGAYLLFGGLVDLAGVSAERRFERDRLIAFKDFEGPALRLAAGDLVAGLPVIAGEADVAGIALERRYDALQPLRNIRPTGRRQFVLERPARIEIYANGALVQAIDVNAGPVDLNRIPALSLSTDIAIIIEDATGRREIDSFTLANDIELLAAGLSEFNLTAGVLRKASAGGFAYSGTPVVTGQFARGFTDVLTAGGHFALTPDYRNAGITVAGVVAGGTLVASGSASHDGASGDFGYALGLAYRGDPFGLSDLGSQLNFRLDYRSADYRRLSQTLAPDPVKLDMAIDYRLPLTERVALALGGNYLESHSGGPASHALFGGVQVAFGRVLASATARHTEIGGRTDRGVLATLTVPLGRNHFSTASHDTVTGQTRFEARRVRDITVPEFDYGVIAEHAPLFDRLTGQARFANSRFNLDLEGVSTRPSRASGGRDRNVVNFRLQSGLALADGTLGIGRNPGRGFVMVDRHPSLAEARVEVETSGVGRRAGQSNALGPAVVSQLSGYRPDNIRVSVLGAPPGYDIGPGEYLSEPGALSGVRLTIGSDAYRSALVTFTLPGGAPVKLADGVVRNLATGETSGVFTNAAGRAVLSKLAEGRYRVELAGGDLVYEFAVDASAPAIMRLGTQEMEVAP